MCSFGLGHLHLYFGKAPSPARSDTRPLVRRRKLAARQDAHVEEKSELLPRFCLGAVRGRSAAEHAPRVKRRTSLSKRT